MSRVSKKSLKYCGTTYRSLLEVEIAKELRRKKKMFNKAFSIKYESEAIPYTLAERLYVPDFKIERKDGSVIYVEVKGYLDRDATRKMLAVKDCNPDKEFVFCFAKDNPIRRGAKMRYSDWCKKHGFDYSIGEVKDEWLT